MDFRNMVICCPGAIQSTSKNECHCDRHKGELPISFSPLNQDFIDTVSYRNDGSIISSNQLYNQEINEVLSLNIGMLKANRKAVRRQLIEFLGKKDWKKNNIEKILKVYMEKDASGRRKEYCGVVVSYLTKKVRSIL